MTNVSNTLADWTACACMQGCLVLSEACAHVLRKHKRCRPESYLNLDYKSKFTCSSTIVSGSHAGLICLNIISDQYWMATTLGGNRHNLKKARIKNKKTKTKTN